MILSEIEDTYKKAHWDDVPVKMDLAIAYRTMATVVYEARHASDATHLRASIDYLIKYMRADGVFVHLPREAHGRKASKASIKLDVKGQPSLGIHHAISMMIIVSIFQPNCVY